MKRILIVLSAALTLFAGCDIYDKEEFNPPATELTADVWTESIFTVNASVHWYKFTATANMQYIHIRFDSFNFTDGLYIQLFNSDGESDGNKKIFKSEDKTPYTLTVGQKYYLKVTPYNYNATGTYKIGFNESTTELITIKLPSNAIQLTADTFTDGEIPSSGEEQWFKFTANAAEQYIHVNFGTLTSRLDFQLYTSKNGYGEPLGNKTDSYAAKFTKLTVGDEYYIKATSSYGSGTFEITFSTLFISPAFAITPLTADTWADGEIPSAGEVQWFKFSATAAEQYIHVSFGTMGGFFGLNIQLYDSNGSNTGDQIKLSVTELKDNRSTLQTVNSGRVYYIKATTMTNTGTYKIAFNTSATPPPP